jgi:hypothetical protein
MRACALPAGSGSEPLSCEAGRVALRVDPVPDGDTFAVYYVCGACWEDLGPDAIGTLAEAALMQGAPVTRNLGGRYGALQAGVHVIRPACFLFEKSLELPCLSQIACTCDGTNCKHRTVKKQHDDQDVRVSHV